MFNSQFDKGAARGKLKFFVRVIIPVLIWSCVLFFVAAIAIVSDRYTGFEDPATELADPDTSPADPTAKINIPEAGLAESKPDVTAPEPGTVLDSLDGVYVYYNGGFSDVHGRHLSDTGYNIGLKYQCVEFVKRYYLYHYGHEMPDSYGHAKDFFAASVGDGQENPARGLLQFTNGSRDMPQKGDLVVFGPTTYNRFGHVAIIAAVGADRIQVIQQNVGTRTRETYAMELRNGLYRIDSDLVSGWLRMKE